MPKYIYTAKSSPHQTLRGDIEAESEQDAINKLTQIGYFPISVQAEVSALNKPGSRRFGKISKRDVVLFTRQLSSLLESGVNILNSLNIISGQSANKYLNVILSDITHKIRDGKSLSESLNNHPRIFFKLYTAMIHSAEVGGNLSQVLSRLADFLEKDEEFRNSVRASLTYPLFIFIVSAITIIVLLGFVIPKLVGMFEDMGQILPLPTKILINISGFLQNYWWLILAIIFVLIFLLRRLYQKPYGKNFLDKFKLNLPVLGNLILKTEVSRLMRILSLLLSSGIPIVFALDVSISVIENNILKLQVEKFKEQIAGGLSFSKAISQSALFPAFVTNIVIVGEEGGTLENSLLRIADDYENEADRTLKALTRLLEPVIILVMGLIVGFIVLSMLLPIFQINLIVR